MDLDATDRRILTVLQKNGRITNAELSEQVNLSPSACHRRVQQLEAHLGTRLMQRSTRKLSLTSAGQDFHDRCAEAVEGLVDAGQSLLTRNDAID
mgnify:CR=1 FL=1